MYGLFGGCTTLFHLAVRYPIIILALSFGGLVHEMQSPGVGDRMGTDAVLAQVQSEIVSTHPGLPMQVDGLKKSFEALSPKPTDAQIRQVLKFTDACTDASVKDVLSNPDKRREAAWLLYLYVYSREGPMKADKLFPVRSSQKR
jgi:hypothetical protein